jgi:hypothetical protein
MQQIKQLNLNVSSQRYITVYNYFKRTQKHLPYISCMTTHTCRILINHNSPSYTTNLLDLIKLAVTSWRTSPRPVQPTYLHQNLIQLFQEQSDVGWDQNLKGRFTKAWYPLISLDTNISSRWLSYTIRQILYCWFDIWKYCCEMNHADSPTSKNERLRMILKPQVQ